MAYITPSMFAGHSIAVPLRRKKQGANREIGVPRRPLRNLQIEDVGVGHAGVVDAAGGGGAAGAGGAACAGDVDAALGGVLACAAVVVGGDDGGRPLIEDAFGDGGSAWRARPVTSETMAR